MSTLQKPRFVAHASDEAFKLLRVRIRQMATANKHAVTRQSANKFMLLALLFIACYLFMVLAVPKLPYLLLAYSALGALSVLLVLNVAHDAVHGSLFKNKYLNYLSIHVLDLVGVSSYIWKKRHVHFHHNYPNIPGWDVDIKQSSLVRIFPDSLYSRIHKYQHLYMPLLYLVYTLNWFFVRDYKDFFSKASVIRQHIVIPRIEYIKLFAFKLFYIFYILLFPVLFCNIPLAYAICGFVVLHVCASIVALVPLLATHVGAEAIFPKQGANGAMQTNWYYHQLVTTNDFDTDSKFFSVLFGGFNHHVAHHMFPDLSHHLFPEATKIIKETVTSFGLPYRCYSLRYCLLSHYRLLKNNSFKENVFEE